MRGGGNGEVFDPPLFGSALSAQSVTLSGRRRRKRRRILADLSIRFASSSLLLCNSSKSSPSG